MVRVIITVCFLAFVATSLSAEDWRVWRGPSLDNHTSQDSDEHVPSSWNSSNAIRWRQDIPGKGHATPIVVGDSIYVLTHSGTQQTISLLRLALETGKPTGRTILHQSVRPPSYLHKKNTCASGTPSSDGETIFAVAQVNDSIQASAVTVDGKIVWQKEVAPYRAGRGWFGYGASPLLLSDSVVVPVETDNADRGLYCLDKATGQQRWRSSRPETTSYSSPILATVGGRPQILISGGYKVVSYDPKDGSEIWSVKATSRTTCGTMVWKENMVFASGSYPDPGTYGIRVDGNRASVAWENRVKCYEQSMLIVGDYLYGIADQGFAYCWRCRDGKEMWKSRLRGPFSASPLLVGDRILASNERGSTFVFRANPQKFELLAENVLGDSSFASPIYAGGKLILRHAESKNGIRQEFLAAISK